MASLLQPVGGIINAEPLAGLPAPEVAPPSPATTKKSKRHKQKINSGSENEAPLAIDFKHAPERYGYPKQQWKTADKAMWLLYVVKDAAGVGELQTRSLVETFNKHFRQSGTITTSNVGRDLGRLKAAGSPSPIGEDTTKTPSAWFLTDEGIRRAQALIAAALGPNE